MVGWLVNGTNWSSKSMRQLTRSCFFLFRSRHKSALLMFNALRTTSLAAMFKSPPQEESIQLLLDKCSTMTELKQIHGRIILGGLSEEALTLGKLIAFSAVADSGDLRYGQAVFDQIAEPNRFMFNSLIRGYSSSDDPSNAISLYRKMVGSGISPNEFTLPFVLKACACESAYWEGVLVHGQAIKLGIGSQVCILNALISVYIGCGLTSGARKVFDDISDRTLVSWNSMIGGYSKLGCLKEAFLLFQGMRQLGMEPDGFTFVSLLSVSSQTRDLDFGRYVHLYIEITGTPTDIYVQNALVDMYAKSGDLHTAQELFDQVHNKNVVTWTSMVSAYANHGLIECAEKIFDQMPMKNLVSWNSMISCYVREGHCRKAQDLFYKMCRKKVVPDENTLITLLSACSQLGDFVMGKKTHNYICRNNLLPSVSLCNSLMDMYAKCGAIGIALDIFEQMSSEKSSVSWNVIIGALALHGCGYKAIEAFEKMQVDGISPDGITFTGLLSACSHCGLVDKGQYYFESMTRIYGVQHEIEHYACMVDLLGRVGLLEKALKLIGGMPIKPDVVVWGALLGACRICGYTGIGKLILKQLLELQPYSGGLYVLLSNIYCEAQRWEDVDKIRKLMKDCGIEKCIATSSIEIDGCIHEFMVDDKRYEGSDGIFVILEQLADHLKLVGCLSAILDEEEI